MERSFAAEVKKLALGEGEILRGEGILAITKALLQSGVSYVGGYPGAPVSHLLDVLADANEHLLEPMGVYLDASANEAAAAALLGASINYPMRGAVTWKSIVGTNVAADALSNLASAGVIGGALIVVGEDYGAGASVIQERTHAFALKSSLCLMDPRPALQNLARMVEEGFGMSEASSLPAVISLRIRAAHLRGSMVCKDNVFPRISMRDPLRRPSFDYARLSHPPSTYAQEAQKFERRLPAARRYIAERGLNEIVPGDDERLGIILQGGLTPTVLRGLELLGHGDVYGRSRVPLLVLNVIHPLVPDQLAGFLEGKERVLVVEEGMPNFIETELKALAYDRGLGVKIHGKDMVAAPGEYVPEVVVAALARFFGGEAERRRAALSAHVGRGRELLASPLPKRPPAFCTGCPERPMFSALKIAQRELGETHVAADIGCHAFATLPPFNMGNTILGYGMGLASASAVAPNFGKRVVSILGDGGFWHSGLTAGVANAVFNKQDSVLVILENFYTSATGQQANPSSGVNPRGDRVQMSIAETIKSLGVSWVRVVNPYKVGDTLRDTQGGHDHGGRRAQGDHRSRGVPARAPAPREARRGGAAQGRPARRGAALRGGPGRVHRRQVVHAAQRLPVAHLEAERRSAPRRSSRPCGPDVRGMWPLRRGGSRRRPVPVVLRGPRGPSPGRVGATPRPHAPPRDRLAPAGVMVQAPRRPVSVLIAALGGQGGGVLTEWLVGAAAHAGYPAQATSIPGVAQRTGATTYYVEVFSERAAPGSPEPVFSLYPTPGDVDVIIGSELLEAARTIEMDYASPERTTLIASTHRLFAIGEKTVAGDGVFSRERLAEAGRKLARRMVAFDALAAARRAGSEVNAVLLGVVAAIESCRWSRADFEAAIARAASPWRGTSPDSSPAWRSSRAGPTAVMPRRRLPGRGGIFARSARRPSAGRGRSSMRSPIAPRRSFPRALHLTLGEAIARLIDFQGAGYAALFLDRVRAMRALDPGMRLTERVRAPPRRVDELRGRHTRGRSQDAAAPLRADPRGERGCSRRRARGDRLPQARPRRDLRHPARRGRRAHRPLGRAALAGGPPDARPARPHDVRPGLSPGVGTGTSAHPAALVAPLSARARGDRPLGRAVKDAPRSTSSSPARWRSWRAGQGLRRRAPPPVRRARAHPRRGAARCDRGGAPQRAGYSGAAERVTAESRRLLNDESTHSPAAR